MTPAVRAFVEALFCRIDELTERVTHLEQELKKDERFRHPPKSTDGTGGDANLDVQGGLAADQSKRRRGGQSGHPKVDRSLIPAEQCADIVDIARLRRCARTCSNSVGILSD